jgi:hypothetical protein
MAGDSPSISHLLQQYEDRLRWNENLKCEELQRFDDAVVKRRTLKEGSASLAPTLTVLLQRSLSSSYAALEWLSSARSASRSDGIPRIRIGHDLGRKCQTDAAHIVDSVPFAVSEMGSRAFSLVHTFRTLRTRTWPLKASSIVTRDVAIVFASCVLAAVLVYRLPPPNADVHVRSSTFGILGFVGALLRVVLFRIDLLITLFWRV